LFLSEYPNEKGLFFMDKVKQAIHYWCDDIRNGCYMGDKIGIAVLDTGE